MPDWILLTIAAVWTMSWVVVGLAMMAHAGPGRRREKGR